MQAAPLCYPGPLPMKDAAVLHIQVNGEDRTVPEDATLASLVETLGLDPRKVAIERNLEIVPKSLHPTTPLTDGDRIEIVQFVGGG